MTNAYCNTLGIDTPTLEQAKHQPDANTYALLLVAPLERGEPMTLAEVAQRFEAAGIASADRALRSLQRCRPARPPVYRDGDRYALDPRDDELDLWAFRLGLRPPNVPTLSIVRPDSGPLRALDEPLCVAELDEAWRHASLRWPAYRLVLAVLEAHGESMAPEDVVKFVDTRCRSHALSAGSRKFRMRGSRVRVTDDGRWAIGDDEDALLATRRAVRDRIQQVRRNPPADPMTYEVARKAGERRRAVHAAKLAALRRVLVHAFPPAAPRAVVLLDIQRRDLVTYLDDGFDTARERIAAYDLIAGVDVRRTLRQLRIDPGERRLAELGPPQKTMTLNRRGRTLRITTELLIQGSCGITRPLGDPKSMTAYLREGKTTRLRRRLEADVKSLFALYQYGRLHGAVRLRWGFLDARFPAPWLHRHEPSLRDLKVRALDGSGALEVVTGRAPGWEDPWARVQRFRVWPEPNGYDVTLLDEVGLPFHDWDVQAARLVGDGMGDR